MNDKNIMNRTLLFLLGCIGTRVGLAEGARQLEGRPVLKNVAPLALLPAIGFLMIFAFGLRKSGPETFGEPIWWNHLRPIHATFYILFAYAAMMQEPGSWRYLYADVALGLLAWLIFHYY